MTIKFLGNQIPQVIVEENKIKHTKSLYDKLNRIKTMAIRKPIRNITYSKEIVNDIYNRVLNAAHIRAEQGYDHVKFYIDVKFCHDKPINECLYKIYSHVIEKLNAKAEYNPKFETYLEFEKFPTLARNAHGFLEKHEDIPYIYVGW